MGGKARRVRRGFTLIELGAVVAGGVVLAALSQPGLERARNSAKQLKESSQLRGMTMSQFMWANQNKDRFVLPSLFDTDDLTVAAKGRAKDTTASIYAMLVWNGSIPTQMLVSPAETNEHIKVDEDAVYTMPKTAVEPARALWDPAFSADFTGSKTGNTSFPHLMPAEERLPLWANTFDSHVVVHSTRAPKITELTFDGDRAAAVVEDAESHTFRFWGKPKGKARSWTGHVALGDGAALRMDNLIRIDAEGKPEAVDTREFGELQTRDPGADAFVFDMPWWEEPGRPANNMLGIFTTAGEKKADYTSIWD